MGQVFLEQSIFIFLGQRAIREHSEQCNQSHIAYKYCLVILGRDLGLLVTNCDQGRSRSWSDVRHWPMSGNDRCQCRVDSENTMGQDHSSLRGVSCQDIMHHPYLFTLETWICLSLNVSSVIRIVSHYLINIKYCLSSYIGECWHNPSGDSLHWAGLCLWWNISTFDLLPVTAMMIVTWQCQWLEAVGTLSRLTEVALWGPP